MARAKVAGCNPAREYIVGMRAERLDRRFVLLNRAGWLVLVGAIASRNLPNSPGVKLGPLDAANTFFVLAVLVLAIARVVRAKTRTYAWIDFQPSAAPLTAADVERTQRAVAHVRGNPDATWVPVEAVLVSGEEGTTPEAIAEAESANVICYRLVGLEFERMRPPLARR